MKQTVIIINISSKPFSDTIRITSNVIVIHHEIGLFLTFSTQYPSSCLLVTFQFTYMRSCNSELPSGNLCTQLPIATIFCRLMILYNYQQGNA